MIRARLLTPWNHMDAGPPAWGLVFVAAALLVVGCTAPPTTDTFWSPDGKTVAYASRGVLQLYDVKTKTSAQLPGARVLPSSLCWSPDGKLLAFYQFPDREDRSGVKSSVGVLSLAAGKVEALQNHAWPRPPETRDPAAPPAEEMIRPLALIYGQPVSWSPDGRQLACVSPDPAGTAISLLSYPAKTEARIAEGDGIIGWLAWSPDGKRIAYARFPRPEPRHNWVSALWVYDLEARTQVRIADLEEGSPVEGTRIVWSADSRQIGFIGRGPGSESDGEHAAHIPGDTIACRVEARPDAKPETVVSEISGVAAWAPGLAGVAFAKFRRDENPPFLSKDTLLIYRGLKPYTWRVLGVLPGVRDVSESSLPQFSPDRRRVALTTGKPGDTPQLRVFTIPWPGRGAVTSPPPTPSETPHTAGRCATRS